jgi:hypothetical protein
MADFEALLREVGYREQNAYPLERLAEQMENPVGVIPYVGAGLSAPFGMPTWQKFLELEAEKLAQQTAVRKLVRQGEFEEAAELLLNASGHRAFEDDLDFHFGPAKTRAKPLVGAVTHLPTLFPGPVITTNFDHVLETVYERAGSRFEHHVWGPNAEIFTKALHQNRHILLKVHGDVEDSTHRVLSLKQYAHYYGSSDPTFFDESLPLPRLFRLMLLQRPVLFLGCSLMNDRLVHILKDNADKHRGVAHYAIVEAPKADRDFQNRALFLSDRGIRPIWFPPGGYTFVERILAAIGEVRGSPSPRMHTAVDDTPDISLEEVLSRSSLALESVETSRLSHIARPDALEPYQREVRRYAAKGGGVIFMTGHAGYGKSTLLKDLCVASGEESGWRALVRCEDLVPGLARSDLDGAFGQALSGTPTPLTAVIRTIQIQRGPGILFIDTLDLILDEATVPPLRAALLDVVKRSGCTVVLACRQFDFDDYLAPAHLKLTGLPVWSSPLPAFSTGEVKEASRRYFAEHPVLRSTSGTGEAFADRIIDLSSDNQPLCEIVHNPLLLGLLCELFGYTGTVPEDLTMSGLYSELWTQKVASRRLPVAEPESEQTRARSKEERITLCLDLAEALFRTSEEGGRLAVLLEQSDLDVSRSDPRSRAYRQLSSEYVFTPAPLDRVRFFHQTFQEYAMARWLISRGQEEAKRLHEVYQRQESASVRHFWQPTIRHLLTMVDTEEYGRWLDALSRLSATGYRTAALAATSRSDGSKLLPSLLETAMDRGEDYQRALRFALDSAPKALLPDVDRISVEMIRRCGKAQAAQIARDLAIKLAGRRGSLDAQRTLLREALAAIASRPPNPAELLRPGVETDDRAELGSTLATQYLGHLGRGPDNGERAVLRDYVFILGDDRARDVVNAHLDPSLHDEERLQLLRSLLPHPLPKVVREETTRLLDRFLPVIAGNGTAATWEWWVSVCDQPPLPDWPIVFAKVVGRTAARDPELLRMLAMDVLDGPNARINPSVIAVSEAVSAGRGADIAALLQASPGENIPTNRRRALENILGATGDPPFRSRRRRRRQEIIGQSEEDLLRLARRDNGLDASRQLLEMAAAGHEQPTIEDLLPLLTVSRPGVKVNSLKAMTALARQGRPLSEALLEGIAAQMSRVMEANAQNEFTKLVGVWVRENERVPLPIAEAIGTLPSRLSSAGRYDGGVARYVIETLGTISRYADDGLLHRIGGWLRQLLEDTDLSPVGNWQRIISILSRVATAHPEFLSNLFDRLKNLAPGQRHAANFEALGMAILNVEGRHSLLLSSLLDADWCPEAAKLEIQDVLDRAL